MKAHKYHWLCVLMHEITLETTAACHGRCALTEERKEKKTQRISPAMVKVITDHRAMPCRLRRAHADGKRVKTSRRVRP